MFADLFTAQAVCTGGGFQCRQAQARAGRGRRLQIDVIFVDSRCGNGARRQGQGAIGLGMVKRQQQRPDRRFLFIGTRSRLSSEAIPRSQGLRVGMSHIVIL